MPDSDYGNLPEDLAFLSKFYLPTDDILIANDAQQIITSTTYVLVKEIKLVFPINPNSTLRFRFFLTAPSGQGYGRIYRNGVPIGTEHVSPPNQEWIEDLPATNWDKNDKLQLWMHSSVGNNVSVINYRICGALCDFMNTIGM
jgi:hypothetical protein